MHRTIRINRWHAVTVKTEHNESSLDIRINSMPDAIAGPDVCSAYLTPRGARKLATVLVEAARAVEGHARKKRRT